MIPSEKELIEALLQAAEGLFVQNLQMRGLLRTAGVVEWRSKLDKPEWRAVASLGREEFRKRYAQAIRTQQELRAFVESLPVSDSVQ